jgi:hypothetical protein
VFAFTQTTFDRFVALRQQRIRIGSQDLRIAAIALTNGAMKPFSHCTDEWCNEALQPVIGFYERNEAVTEHGEE